MDPGTFNSLPFFLLWILSGALGLFFLWKVLSVFFDQPVVLFSAFLILFGTNCFWQIFFAGPSANMLLFTLFLVMILLSHVWQRELNWIPLLIMLPVMIVISFLSAGGIFIMLFPIILAVGDSPFSFLAGAGDRVSGSSADVNEFHFRSYRSQLLFLAGIFTLCLTLRQFPGFSDPGRAFYFGNTLKSQFPVLPANIHRVLFSVNNGWLVYSPLVIFSFAGFYFLAEKHKACFLAAFLFVLVSLVSAASNPAWWFEHSFGYPNLVETYAVLSIPLGFLIQRAWTGNRKSRILLFVLAGFLVFLNLFQTWQFERSILLPGRMTGKYYCSIFGKTKVTPGETRLLEPSCRGFTDTIPVEPWIKFSRIGYFDFENRMDNCEPFRLERAAHSGKYGLLMNPQHRFSPGLNIPVRQFSEHDSTWITTTGYFFFDCKNPFNKVSLVITCTHQGNPYKYKVTDLSATGYQPHRWNKVTMSYLVPFQVDPGDLLQVYFMNYGEEECYIDDFEIGICKSTL